MSSEQAFTGGVFSDTIDGGRAGAEIELRVGGICARTPDGEFTVPYNECQLEIGGYSGRMVFCRTPDRSLTIFCEQRGFTDALSRASAGILTDQLDAQRTTRRREARRGRRIVTAVLVVILVLLVGGYFAIRAGARAAIRAVPVSVDRQIGKAAFGSMDLGGPEINDPVIVEAMQSMVDRMAPHAAIDGMEFKVHVIDSPSVNAFALPGGTMVVFTGLIEQADEPEQVAGVLGHEMAHATLRHGLQRIAQSIGLGAAIGIVLGDTQGLIAAGAELFHMASINSYSRDQENAADAEGVRMLHAAGIDPMALAQFFERLNEEQGDVPGVISWMSTHPEHEDRIEAVRLLVAELPKRDYEPLSIDWGEIQQRLAQGE